MSEETILETAEEEISASASTAKKKTAKKAAKKAARKTATKKVAKKKTAEAVVEETTDAPEVVEPASVDVEEAAPKKKRATKKKATEPVLAEEAPAPEVPVAEPVEQTPAPQPSPVAEAEKPAEPPESNEASDAGDGDEAEEGDEESATNDAGGDARNNRDSKAMPASIAALGYTVASNGEWMHPTGRRLRWWERRKLERKARQKERAAAAGGAAPAQPQQQAPRPHHHRESNAAAAEESDIEPPKPADLGPPEASEGLLEIGQKGHGFLRLREKSWNPLPTDCFVHGDIIRKFGLREGMYVKGEQRKGPRGPQLTEVFEINGRKPEDLRELPIFEELKAVNPNKRYQLETRADRYTTRVIDMLTPIGRGQRGLIVSPPRAGKTTILQHIAEAVMQNYENVKVIILLIDERPEEVTEFKRTLTSAELFASSNDQDAKSHGRIAQLAVERAKRLVEMGEHVFMLMDSITRLARAFNSMNKGGATMSGGMGVGSMEIPRRLFAAARNTRTAGSLTIIATALVETGGKIDDLIFQEFKGTGNMELVLDRKIAEQYIWPAVNIFKSGTRREELLLQSFQLEKIHFLRRGLAGHKPIEAIQRVLSLMERYPNNAQMLVELSSKEK